MKPVGVQLSRKKGWRMPENTVKVDRTNRRFGNPFRIGGWFMVGDPAPRGVFRMSWCQRNIWNPEDIEDAKEKGFTLIKDAETAVEFFRRLAGRGYFHEADLATIRGKNLACWCKLGTACHRDVLLEIANA